MTVGVIVPVYAAGGRPPYLEEALAGVFAQDPAPDRVIVVDDGSAAPVRVPSAHEARCELIRRESRGGPGPARDEALAVLSTDLIACADADDVWLPGKLAAQLEALERAPQAALCFGTAVVVGPDGEPTGERWRTVGPEPLSAADLYAHNPIPTSSVLVRRSSVLAAGGFTGPPLCEDWELWLRLLGRGEQFVLAPDARILYRRHPAGATADIAALAESALRVHEDHAALVDEDTRRQVRAADLIALARGRVRGRRYEEARHALDDAARLQPLSGRDSALRLVLTVPGARALLGRRAPY